MAAGVGQRAIALHAAIFNSCTSFPHRYRQAMDFGERYPETDPMAILYAMAL